ncbi:ABC transporter substrate-binding protein [Parasphingopyxis marina]|uniref:ABC transporter substrate-binding protein n=1 Tax=Parasphingopyxis marina TaxID=2761622 RepID=A0A842I2X0_9SPHN|nr:ABC transporter substrate-binding protein [Parasphingopyxis marina]MBC2779143.1 ABC transporter substrate-binding protein [Parasphingopyxis marina]
MALDRLTIGFLPLVDAALPILAQEHGFAEAEGLELSFVRDMSWATVLDRLLYGHSDAAHLLAPLAIATTLGRGRPAKPLAVPFVLGLNGNAVTLSQDLAARLVETGKLGDPNATGSALAREIMRLAKTGQRLRFGVVHRYSSHNYMLRYWLAASGIAPDRDVDIVTVAPPFAADALAAGEVDGICVGEPWNSVAVEQGAGRIAIVTSQIWRRGVEKVLAVPEAVLEDKAPLFERLIRALLSAGRNFIDPDSWDANAALLARPEYLDGSAALIRRAISDRILLARDTAPVHIPDFMFQHRDAANFPWKSQAAWLYSQLVRWDGLTYAAEDAERAGHVFRPDFYRGAVSGHDEPLPGASSKVEGGLETMIAVGGTQGRLALGPDVFFDGRTFDPDDISGYLEALPVVK